MTDIKKRHPLSLETKLKISAKNKGMIRTPEQRKRISDGHKGISIFKGGTIACLCLNCSKIFFTQRARLKQGRGRYCSRKCYERSKGYSAKCVCKICGKEFMRTHSLMREGGNYCSLECSAKGMKGRAVSQETRMKISAGQKLREPMSIEARLKISKAKTGAGNNHWLGGISFGKYCPKFTRKFKERVRAFFNYCCVICKHVWQPGEPKLSVHHVYYNKGACCVETNEGKLIHTLPDGIKIEVKGDPNKFVSLCTANTGRGCHSITNFNHLKWALQFEQLINEQYGGRSYFTEDEMMKMEGGV